MQLRIDENKWEEKQVSTVNTLQLFITNTCNLRCKGCFYNHKLNNQKMTLDQYESHINEYSNIQKVILLGGEPTLHPDLLKMIEFNRSKNLKTTVYTNGINLKRLDSEEFYDVEVRVGVYGAYESEKPLSKIKQVTRPLTIVYMLRKDNIHEFPIVVKMIENYNCNKFYISSIRDIAKTGDFWKDTEETISPNEYAEFVQLFVDNYNGNIQELHISKRGVFENGNHTNVCRFGNIFPDDEKIICPFDISKKITTDKLEFGTRKCNKNGCILQKIVLKRKIK